MEVTQYGLADGRASKRRLSGRDLKNELFDARVSATHPDDPHRLARRHRLRAPVLGATDRMLSVSTFPVGSAAAQSDRDAVAIMGSADLVSGTISIAARKEMSVSSRSRIERAEYSDKSCSDLATRAYPGFAR